MPLRQIDRARAAHRQFGYGDLQIVVFQDAVGDDVGRVERGELRLLPATEQAAGQRRTRILHHAEQVDALDRTLVDMDRALAAERADDLALALAVPVDPGHLDAAGAREGSEISRIAQEGQ